jgi:hypothetical protein
MEPCFGIIPGNSTWAIRPLNERVYAWCFWPCPWRLACAIPLCEPLSLLSLLLQSLRRIASSGGNQVGPIMQHLIPIVIALAILGGMGACIVQL